VGAQRAADALGKIGGPKVIDAVLQLVRDKDEDIRRAAIEILNQTKDERAVDSLIHATRDSDWWVSERAVDALAEIGSKRAVPRLMEMLQTRAAARPCRSWCARSASWATAARDTLLPSGRATRTRDPHRGDPGVVARRRRGRAEQVRLELQAQMASPDQTISRMAAAAVNELDNRIAVSRRSPPGQRPRRRRRHTAAAAHAGRDSPHAADPDRRSARPPSRRKPPRQLDIQTLKSGDIIEGRYKYIDRIGRGAFARAADGGHGRRRAADPEFLNPNVSQDEEVMKRFVHELRYSRKITHKNVIRIYDFLYIQGLYAISMEYFPSHTLGSEVVNDKPIELQRALQFGIDMCTGMTVRAPGRHRAPRSEARQRAHQPGGALKIVDFGVAAAQREGDTQLTKTGYVIGSPKYMAPEQILGKRSTSAPTSTPWVS